MSNIHDSNMLNNDEAIVFLFSSNFTRHTVDSTMYGTNTKILGHKIITIPGNKGFILFNKNNRFYCLSLKTLQIYKDYNYQYSLFFLPDTEYYFTYKMHSTSNIEIPNKINYIGMVKKIYWLNEKTFFNRNPNIQILNNGNLPYNLSGGTVKMVELSDGVFKYKININDDGFLSINASRTTTKPGITMIGVSPKYDHSISSSSTSTSPSLSRVPSTAFVTPSVPSVPPPPQPYPSISSSSSSSISTSSTPLPPSTVSDPANPLSNPAHNNIHPIDLTHIWYKNWPDHGVPNNMYTFKHFIFNIYKKIKDNPGNVLIHCSAGVGRTGVVYIILLLLSKNPQGDIKISLDEIIREVLSARTHRPHMVQTIHQLIFIYNFFNHEGYDISLTEEELYEKLTPLQQQNFKTNFGNHNPNFNSYRMKDCKYKNRYANILPYHAKTHTNCETYINASYMAPFNINKHDYTVLAAQCPTSTPETLLNFTNMIVQNTIKYIIMVTNFSENGKIKCHDYFNYENSDNHYLHPIQNSYYMHRYRNTDIWSEINYRAYYFDISHVKQDMHSSPPIKVSEMTEHIINIPEQQHASHPSRTVSVSSESHDKPTEEQRRYLAQQAYIQLAQVPQAQPLSRTVSVSSQSHKPTEEQRRFLAQQAHRVNSGRYSSEKWKDNEQAGGLRKNLQYYKLKYFSYESDV
jgi:protein tyrosine phosphatase